MVSHASRTPLAFLPSPSISGFHVGPLFVHFYGLMYVVGIALAIYITRRRWSALGGDPVLVADVATWAVPAGIIGGRIYFDITTPADIPPHWWGVFAVWSGGLGIWGGIALGAAAGIWRVRRAGASASLFANAIAPALLVAQAVGRIGNYFNQELFGKPSGLPWALEISPSHRPGGYGAFGTFQPTFLYELIFDLAWAAVLVWLGHHRNIRAPGLFALYVAGYSAFRIFEETLRIDSSEHFLGLRLNFYVASIGVIAGLTWFVLSQRRARGTAPPGGDDEGGDVAGDAGIGGDADLAEHSDLAEHRDPAEHGEQDGDRRPDGPDGAAVQSATSET
ncbi:MAG TPA: prolipoprotein diacylglyceryl transferase [Streptosporangiaceae bacterium]|jgi:prolipoprotein diacylglyceryl transferase